MAYRLTLRHAVPSLGLLLAGGASFGQDLSAVDRVPITVTRAQHMRLPVRAPIQRIAVGDPETLSAEALNNREILLLGKTSGRTTLLVWFSDGSVIEYICTVQRDLSLLQSALKRIYPSIEAEIAPDRDAIVLTGVVPDLTYLQAAEGAARNYLSAQTNQNSRVLVQAVGAPGAPQPGTPGQPAAAAPAGEVRVAAGAQPAGGAVINLIRLETLPALPEQKITEAVRGIGGAAVTVRRVLKGPLRDDTQDLFVLEGRVPDQVSLTRILTLAANVVTGQAINAQDIRVIGDEAGALAMGGNGGVGGATGGGGGGIGGGIGGAGGGAGGNLNNLISRNIGRAKVLQAGNGRILSFLDVADLPQVRIDIRLYEIDRSKLKTYSPNITAQVGRKVALAAPALGQALENPVATVGPNTAVQTLLGFLGGTLNGETQLTAGRFAMDALLTYLEQAGIARSLSSPSLTVLSGEQAQFQVGGDIPVPESFSPALGGTTGGAAGVFSSVTFLPYGISLSIRPLVGEEDVITLDVQPQVSTPDATTTASIRQNTGNNLPTTALQTRSLRTSARLQDGQLLVLGGLLSNNTNDTQAATPGLSSIPGLGWLFKNLNRTDDSQELVIVVNPVIVRDPMPAVALWEFPGTEEMTVGFTRPAAVKPDGKKQ
jgi:pilus assembly protein CpaC